MDTQYLADKKIKSIKETGRATPLSCPILEVSFTDGSTREISDKRYKLVMTHRPSDATSERNELIKQLGSMIYSFLMEYSVKLSEVDPILNEVVRLTDAASSRATELLFKTAYLPDRTLDLINAVIIKNQNGEQDGDNGASSAGGGAD